MKSAEGGAAVGTPLRNPRWEAFALAYVRLCGDATKAYREVYPFAAKWKDESVWTRASRLLNDAKVMPRVRELQAIVSAEGVASADEVAKFLTQVLRADARVASPMIGPTGCAVLHPATGLPLTVPPPLRLRIAAADKINRMLGYNKPLKVDVSKAPDVPEDADVEARLSAYAAAENKCREGCHGRTRETRRGSPSPSSIGWAKVERKMQ